MSDDDIEDEKATDLLDKNEVTTILKCSARQLQRMIANGKLVPATSKQGVASKFKRSDVMSLREEREESVEMTDDVTMLVSEMRKGLEIANRHVNNLLMNVVEPLKLHNHAISTEMSALRERYNTLLDKYLGALDKWEESAQQVHERELASFTVKASEKRKTDAWEFATKVLLPNLATQVAGAKVVSELVSSLTDEQLGAMLDPTLGFLTASQREQLEHVLKHAKAAQDPSRNVREPTGQDREGAGPAGSGNAGSNGAPG